MKTTKTLLSLVLAVFGFGLSNLFAQAPDTVCAGTPGKSYWVNNTPGSTYQWIVAGGTQASGTNTNSITINFSSTVGTDTITVIETNSNGCIGDPVKLAVVRMPLPTATITGPVTICANDSTTASIALTGTAPWNFTYTNGTTPVSVTGISSSPYVFNTGMLTTSTTYTVTAITDRLGCVGTYSGSAPITVNPRPVTSVIFH